MPPMVLDGQVDAIQTYDKTKYVPIDTQGRKVSELGLILMTIRQVATRQTCPPTQMKVAS